MSSGLTVARQRRWRYVLPIVLTLLIAVLVFVWWRLPLAVSPADAWFLMKARGAYRSGGFHTGDSLDDRLAGAGSDS